MTGESANHDAVGKKCSSFEETYSSCVEDPVYHSIQLILKKGQFAQITQNVILVECNDAEDFLRKPSLKKKKGKKSTSSLSGTIVQNVPAGPLSVVLGKQ